MVRIKEADCICLVPFYPNNKPRHTVGNIIVTITIVGALVLIVARLSFGTRDGHFKQPDVVHANGERKKGKQHELSGHLNKTM